MYTKTVIRANQNIRESRRKQLILLQVIDDYAAEVMDACPHELVVLFRDTHPKPVFVDGSVYCPACDKLITNTIATTKVVNLFGHSKVLPLTELSLINNNETLDAIKKEVIEHYDEYLSGTKNEKDLVELLRSEEYTFDRATNQMRKVLK